MKRRKVSLKECLRRIKQSEQDAPKMSNDDLATAKQSCHFIVDGDNKAKEEK